MTGKLKERKGCIAFVAVLVLTSLAVSCSAQEYNTTFQCLDDLKWGECVEPRESCVAGCGGDYYEKKKCRGLCGLEMQKCLISLYDKCMGLAAWECDKGKCDYADAAGALDCTVKYTNSYQGIDLFGYTDREAYDACMKPIEERQRECWDSLGDICCSDGIRNRNERGVDCGGRCEPCTTTTIVTTTTLKRENCGDGRCEGLSESCYSCREDCKCPEKTTCIRDLPAEYTNSDLAVDWMGCATVREGHEMINPKRFPPYNNSVDYCGPESNRFISFLVRREHLTSDADFNRACYNHDKCYAECAITGNSKYHCDKEFNDHMDRICDTMFDIYREQCKEKRWYNPLKIPCHIYTSLNKGTCKLQSDAYEVGVKLGATLFHAYKC
ncbi:MAG: hypothetical protein GF416_01025 [Candidatus Altiarchaeales archaeon]|nr:hypothetical protein [Candidatus Altiarchaeales archaeon]MBD3415698.1 hypothetical protein [Candidatus Altiarchaeales archaeon]